MFLTYVPDLCSCHPCTLRVQGMASELQDVAMSGVDLPSRGSALPELPDDGEPKYGGFTRFELELELVQALGNPQYLNHLAARKFLQNPEFVAYLDYLQYWSRPPYVKYLTYPGPTLKALQLLQHEQFRRDIISPDLVFALMQEGMKGAVDWHRER